MGVTHPRTVCRSADQSYIGRKSLELSVTHRDYLIDKKSMIYTSVFYRDVWEVLGITRFSTAWWGLDFKGRLPEKQHFRQLTLLNATYFQNYLTRGGAQSSSNLKSAVLSIFLHTKQQKTFQGTLETQDHTSIVSKTILGPSMDPTRPLKWTLWFLRKFRDFWENFWFFYILHSLAPLTMLEHLFGHCLTVPRLRGPSWTFMDLQMDP